MINYFLLFVFILLEICDSISTYIGIKHYGCIEGNPIATKRFKRFGLIPTFITDFILTLFFFGLVCYKYESAFYHFIIIACILKISVVIINTLGILKKKNSQLLKVD